jgi:hypothetical protein
MKQASSQMQAALGSDTARLMMSTKPPTEAQTVLHITKERSMERFRERAPAHPQRGMKAAITVVAVRN